MHPEGDQSDSASTVQRRAALARERAERELAAAARQERLAQRTGLAVHERLAQVHRTSAACHRTAAELQETYARHLSRWEEGVGAPPNFMTGVAEVCGARGAVLTFVGADEGQPAVAASDEPARAAQELEFLLGEGPGREAAARRRAVSAAGRQLSERWPGYGAGLGELGIDEVAAVPLRLQGGTIGSLAIFDPLPGFAAGFLSVAEALTRTGVLGPEADPELYGGTDHRAVVRQAAVLVAVRAGHPVEDALELIKARAFSGSEPVHEVAVRIVRGELRLP